MFLTGVGAESQRGLEAPGVEVRGSSLKHERHRQRNKHDLRPGSCFGLANNVSGRALSSGESWPVLLVVDSFGDVFGLESLT